MRLLHLYRPRLPTTRAQAIQVVHTCHALARRGHTVTLLCDRTGPEDTDALAPVADPAQALAAYGLDHPPGLDLRIAPARHPTAAGLWFRWERARWRGDLVYARAKRYVAGVPAEVPVVLEVHEVDSLFAVEAGRDPAPARRLEAAVLERAAGVVANCAQTLAALAETHPLPARQRVIWNATRGPAPAPPAAGPVRRIGYAGLPRAWKGVDLLGAVAEHLPPDVEIELLGGGTPSHPRIRVRPPVPYGALGAALGRYDVLVLPLRDNLYGRRLANPLKLWDYLATGLPLVAADLPTVREVAGSRPFYHRPDDPAGLLAALQGALAAPRGAPMVRTWDERAAEIEAFLHEVVG